ncbi:tetratricopeptide repeat-containing sensor histidine kinase [Synoicihabitans lomoniglobus]|uniref:Histidine kinase n=1 Tax=Synoicihabitans lomoniglobus TaxID=2909285 RepID=A0AAF0CME7_9BACT|nr:histidine kinase [Opitutaceae bacterium LMO-M01]WED64008.1 histidine kinase [Opitutaceae bacterium LMO-M01]
MVGIAHRHETRIRRGLSFYKGVVFWLISAAVSAQVHDVSSPDNDPNGEKMLQEAIERRVTQDGLDEPHAAILVRRRFSANEAAQERWPRAISHLNQAIRLAETLQEAELLADLYLTSARLHLRINQSEIALRDAQRAWELSRNVNFPDLQLAAGVAVTEVLQTLDRDRNSEPYFDALIKLPGADLLNIEVRRAVSTMTWNTALAEARWQDVVARAKEDNSLQIQARALDELGQIFQARNDSAQAVAMFAACDALESDHRRSRLAWYDYSQALSAGGRNEDARRAIEQGLADLDVTISPDVAADFEDARATLLARMGDTDGAYAAVRRAQKLKRAANTSGFRMPQTRLVPAMPTSRTEDAAILAATRAALREAELESTRLQRGRAIGFATSVTLLAALLGLVLLYKRRAAANLATARDAAELRAENAGLLALRHQLNPHFLFNALNSLRSRVHRGRGNAAELIDHLTVFCRQALQAKPEGIATVAEEQEMLTAFLDIEQARWEDNLQVTLDLDPLAADRALPTLLLLPLVENALKYGAQTSEECIVASIRLHAPDAQTLDIEISNSGRWIEPGSAPPSISNGVGLDNIRERLQRLYPARHHFDVGPSPVGVTARLKLLGEPQAS